MCTYKQTSVSSHNVDENEKEWIQKKKKKKVEGRREKITRQEETISFYGRENTGTGKYEIRAK